MFFYSIPQPRNHDEIMSSVVAAYVTKNPFRDYVNRLSNINGLFFFFHRDTASTDKELIFNPSTRQSLSIPNKNLKRRTICNSFMVYDPIEKQYKLLSIANPYYQVLTLGSGNFLWRDILCSTEHKPIGGGICIDGVLYYLALAAIGYIMLVSFDIKSEKFSFMKNYIEEPSIGILVDYNGKLGSVMVDDTTRVTGSNAILKIWVLEDPKKQEWSQHIHVLPPLWEDVVGEDLLIVGMIGTDDIVFSYSDSNFYLVYYNIRKKNVVKVEIRGMEEGMDNVVYTFLNHVENLKLLS